jgi:hypothetical protein
MIVFMFSHWLYCITGAQGLLAGESGDLQNSKRSAVPRHLLPLENASWAIW